MGLLSVLSKPLASLAARQTRSWSRNGTETQQRVFEKLIQGGKNTLFGREHDFQNIKSYDDFKERVPVSDYEDLKPYIEKIKNGEENILWKGRPVYLSKTSGKPPA